MCTYSATDGFANDWHLVHLGSRAIGGAGLIMQEATAVSPEGRITPSDLGVYHDEQIAMLKKITSFIQQHGAVAGIQLAHAGRKASCAVPWEGGQQLKKEQGGWTTVSSSDKRFSPTDDTPHALAHSEIQQIINNFKTAASRSLKAGYQVIEIHAAHGYLIHQFLSPLSNYRTDNYGGSFENRVRFLLEIVDAIKEVWPAELPLFVRLSATDWADGGWNIEETVQLTTLLKQRDVDLIDCSSAGMVPYAKVPLSPGYQVPFSERIRRESGILTGAVGLITQAHQAEAILQKREADLIFIARESLRDPHFPLNAARALNEEIDWPRQLLRAK
jgi:2,4-dienoyl-CoA reductase-like NADH-dependent reductase (Old Yellow Enzyme family)